MILSREGSEGPGGQGPLDLWSDHPACTAHTHTQTHTHTHTAPHLQSLIHTHTHTLKEYISHIASSWLQVPAKSAPTPSSHTHTITHTHTHTHTLQAADSSHMPAPDERAAGTSRCWYERRTATRTTRSWALIYLLRQNHFGLWLIHELLLYQTGSSENKEI